MIDYKNIIKSRKLRRKILRWLSFVPDDIMLKLQYKIKTGKTLDLKNPERFTEKIQWYKMNYRNPIMHKCVDKFLVRDYVKSKGLGNILVPLIGKFDSVKHVDWDNLPDKFVIKTTHGGGGVNVIVCNDKKTIDLDEVKEKLQCDLEPVKANTMGREWAYYGLQPGIVVEKLLINNENPAAGINDYKIFCYGGHAKYIVVDVDRYIGHKRNFYDREWKRLNVLSDCPACDREVEKPSNLNEMLIIAEKLSEEFPFVRVDLYNVGGKIFFGELTFYPWCGYVQFTPDDMDYILGKDFELNRLV